MIGADGISYFLDCAAETIMDIRVQLSSCVPATELETAGARLDMVRVGTILYGQNPAGVAAPFALENVFSWRARVVNVRDLEPGDPVGYDGEWRAKRRTRVATIPVGWADGFTVEPHARTESLGEAARTTARALAVAARARPSGRFVSLEGAKLPVVGRVGMQATTVEIGDGRVGVGDVVTVPARRLLVSPAIERVYVP